MPNGGILAALGDAVWEVAVRQHLIKQGINNLQKLHDLGVAYVSAEAQAALAERLLPLLTAEEVAAFHRGRNYKYTARTASYTQASGFEAVLGFLAYTGAEARLAELTEQALKIAEEASGNYLR